MGRKKKTEPTAEQILKEEKERGLFDIARKIQFVNNPSYFFNCGEEVKFGAFKSCIIDEVYYDGKAYGLKCVSEKETYGEIIKEECYRVAIWTDVRPTDPGISNFSKNQDVRILFFDQTIESLIHYYYSFGINMNPDYQRGYVWEQEDKENLIDSIFNNIEIGKIALIKKDYDKYRYEILDGKQRLSTLIDFYENKLAYKGKFYNDLSIADRRTFKKHSVSVAHVDNCDKSTILKYFLILNRSGKVMDGNHISKVEKMFEDLNKKEN